MASWWILASVWSRVITCPGYWPLIGREWSWWSSPWKWEKYLAKKLYEFEFSIINVQLYDNGIYGCMRDYGGTMVTCWDNNHWPGEMLSCQHLAVNWSRRSSRVLQTDSPWALGCPVQGEWFFLQKNKNILVSKQSENFELSLAEKFVDDLSSGRQLKTDKFSAKIFLPKYQLESWKFQIDICEKRFL